MSWASGIKTVVFSGTSLATAAGAFQQASSHNMTAASLLGVTALTASFIAGANFHESTHDQAQPQGPTRD